jgi:hypothetical protein
MRDRVSTVGSELVASAVVVASAFEVLAVEDAAAG